MTVENISLSISMKECCRPGKDRTRNLLITCQTRMQLNHRGRPGGLSISNYPTMVYGIESRGSAQTDDPMYTARHGRKDPYPRKNQKSKRTLDSLFAIFVLYFNSLCGVTRPKYLWKSKQKCFVKHHFAFRPNPIPCISKYFLRIYPNLYETDCI